MLVIQRSLQGIVEMGGSVPDPVSLIDEHMIHLYREPHIQRGLPSMIMNVRSDLECATLMLTVPDDIQSRILYHRKIEPDIMIPVIFSPLF